MPTYISGLAGGNTGYFVDTNGVPTLWVANETWGLPTNAGRWNGGNWQLDFDDFFSSRAAQGVTVLLTDALGNIVDGGLSNNGNTWDGVAPFVTGVDPSSGLNATFWARIDYMMASALNNGITIGFTFNLVYDAPSSGFVMFGWTATQYQNYGNALGTRYGAQPNLIWMFGNDDFPTTNDTHYTSIMTGLTAAGDTHLRGAWWSAEYTSRYEADNNTVSSFGAANSAFNFCYSYNASYWIIEYAYGEVVNQGQAHLLPTILGDGYFYQGGPAYQSLDRNMRQEMWWALASGARGVLFESEALWKWDFSGAAAGVTSEWFPVNNLPHIVSAFTGLSGWQNLIPDTGNALVTGGRGTRVTGFASGGSGGAYENAFTNSYVAASVTPDKVLAVLYLPNHTTITVDQTKVGAGYGAKWMDPITGATTAATVGSTYNSTAQGTNSQGDPDWVLVLATPPYATWTVP